MSYNMYIFCFRSMRHNCVSHTRDMTWAAHGQCHGYYSTCEA